MIDKFDFLIIGAGIVGISIAMELKSRYKNARIMLMEKESTLGAHASGRNSGVIHAGFYYSSDSLKAKLTRKGNQALHNFCDEMKIPVNRCGKLVVAKNEQEDKQLDVLYNLGNKNGVPLELLDKNQAMEIEPRIKTFKRCLYSPTTSSVNPHHVLEKLYALLHELKVEFSFNEAYINSVGTKVQSSKRKIEAGFIFNCAGTYADRIAKRFNVGHEYKILPFKGLYLYSNELSGSFKTNIYPVPDMKLPFLGVHFTLTSDGRAKIGPTAIPALWNEHYAGMKNFSFREFISVSSLGTSLLRKQQFRRLAKSEFEKYKRKNLVKAATSLASGVKVQNFMKWGNPGIRAQLVHLPSNKLEMDFVIKKSSRSIHVLNAVSPAFTCSFPFSKLVCDRV